MIGLDMEQTQTMQHKQIQNLAKKILKDYNTDSVKEEDCIKLAELVLLSPQPK